MNNGKPGREANPPAVGRDDAKPSRAKKVRRPHNKAPPDEIETLEDLVAKIGGERCRVVKDGEVTEMTRVERRLRLEAAAAIEGNIRALANMINLMMKYPSIVRTNKKEIWYPISEADHNL